MRKSGLWNMVAGFDHKGLAEAAKAQYDRFPGYHAFFGRMSDQTVALSERLVEVSPFARGKCSTPIPGPRRMTRWSRCLVPGPGRGAAAAPQDPDAMERLSRGDGRFSASMTGKPYNSVFGLPLPGFLHLTCPHYWREGKEGESEAEFTARLAREHGRGDRARRRGYDRRVLRRAGDGRGGSDPAPSAGYFQAIQPILRKAWHPADLRRGDLRLRADGEYLGLRDL